MNYKLKFLPSALKEWKKLGVTVQSQLKKKLEERLKNPIVPADRLRGFENYYKIKLKSSGYRLVYEVEKSLITVFVISIGKRDNLTVYRNAKNRNNK